MTKREEWRPIPLTPGYEASDHGRIRSVIRGHGHIYGHIMSPFIDSRGHYRKLQILANGVKKTYSVHRLVAEAFHGPLPAGLETRHLNGDPFDNRPTNLRYGTHAENMQDAVAHGSFGAQTHCARGHEYSPENTRVRTSGTRLCRTCARASQRERRRALKLAS